ncbi:MAG: hypothetical protein JST53_18770 [Actinobacteria bacterium]|nr:hypothetical protein [Actinomycetota bacterium]
MKGDRRAKVAAAATVVGLATLGGVALGTNHGMTPTLGSPVASTGGNGRAPIVTSASGSTTTTAAATTGQAAEGRHNPIVTRTSGGAAGGGGVVADD